jgi:hypothetical protein
MIITMFAEKLDINRSRTLNSNHEKLRTRTFCGVMQITN